MEHDALLATVVVPTYNRRESLERCLNALLDQTLNSNAYEVVVVDDCSSDDTSTYMAIKLQQVFNLVYIQHAQNQGLAATRNDGIRVALGDIVIFLDNDNVVERDFIESHLGCHARWYPEHVAVVGNAQYAPEIIAGSNFGRYLQSRYLGCRSPAERRKLDYTNLPPSYLAGLNHSIRKEDLFAAGLFDTSFRFYGGEDEHMGFCLKRLDVRIVFEERARSLHYDQVSLARYKLKLTEAASSGLQIILSKNPDYASLTNIGWLLPIRRGQDSLKRVAGKLAIRLLINPLVIFLLEKWAIATDQVSWTYWPLLYRVLTAGWILSKQKAKHGGVRLVTYGDKAS